MEKHEKGSDKKPLSKKEKRERVLIAIFIIILFIILMVLSYSNIEILHITARRITTIPMPVPVFRFL